MSRFFILLYIIVSGFAYADDEMVYNLGRRVNELTEKLEQLEHKNYLLQKRLDSLAEDVEFRMKGLSAKPKAESSEDAPVAAKQADSKQSKVEFDAAYNLLKEQKYDEAEKAFTQFLDSHPKSEYAGNAYYWLGESFALRKRFDKAAVNYLQSFNKFPKNSKADISILKLSVALNMLGKKKESCSMLAKLKAKNDSLSAAMQQMLQKELAKSSCK